MLLADNGATIIKIEPPEGDRLRRSRAAGFLVWNREKESRVIDLRSAAGEHELRDLATEADVVIEAFGLGVAQRWGVDYEHLNSNARAGMVLHQRVRVHGAVRPSVWC
jgi:crotonobetainyl-CoA:carnitine CoA-transferase CaiB-like acyl-CoA transferase